MNKIEIKGAIIPNNSIEAYKKEGKEYTALQDIELPPSSEPIEVIINSGGGDVFTGSEIYSRLKDHKGQVIVKIVGVCASIASVIAMAGDTVEMSPTGLFMIHNAMAWTYGNTKEHKKQIEALEVVNNSIALAYQNKTGLPMETIRNLMEEETWFSCDRALEYGFVDKQMFMKKISREMVASILEHVPEQGRHLFMENVIKKNLDKIDANIDELKSIKNNKNQSYGQKLMTLGVKDKKNNLSYGQKLMTIGLTPNKKPTTKQMLRVANDAEKIVMLLTLEARHEALKSIREKRFEQIQKEIKGSYSEPYLNEGYQAGDVILENGKTVLVAQGLNDYQSKADELRR
ncbi:head maturation protease, ClpP-related [Streptococcus sp.]|uniref:head maturation protease, ClpP-related n=1 Tax=Streptococcus sp. TaxID=1306 RepID=UPI003AB47A1C